MKTVRFTQVAENCGKPEIYLPLSDPAKDQTLQKAVKAIRVMTVVQPTVGTKTDRGVIGFESGKSRQFLIFPKSLRAFARRTVVGVKYDLFELQEVPKKNRSSPPKAARKPKLKRQANPRKEPEPAPRKVVAFTPPKDDEELEEVTDIKKQVRQAMKALEDGKQVAAFNLLKRIVAE